MIAELTFEPGPGVRAARFVRRAGIPIDAACEVANGIRAALADVLGGRDVVAIGEPQHASSATWRAVTQGSFIFVVPGARTELVFVVAPRDARALVFAAFGETPDGSAGLLSEGETQTFLRIMQRCAHASAALTGEPRATARRVAPDETPVCTALFEVRLRAPINATILVGLARPIAEPISVTGRIAPAALDGVTVRGNVVLGRGSLAAGRIAALAVGDVVRLNTKVGMLSELNLDGQRIAQGVCGVRAGHFAIRIQATATMGVSP